MTDWLRLWHDMPTDPKWRVVARKSGQPLSCVLAVWTLMLTNASAHAADRGRLLAWSDEDAGAALDMDEAGVRAIYNAMQGKVLDGDRLTGWERRQPKREDSSAARVAEHRAKKRAETIPVGDVTPGNAEQRTREDTDTDTDNSEPNGSAEAEPRPALASPKDRIWSKAPELAVRAGRAESTVRGFLGKVLSEFDAELVEPAVNAALAEGSGDPCAFITRILKPAGNRPRGSPIPNSFQDFDVEALKAARQAKLSQRQDTMQ